MLQDSSVDEQQNDTASFEIRWSLARQLLRSNSLRDIREILRNVVNVCVKPFQLLFAPRENFGQPLSLPKSDQDGDKCAAQSDTLGREPLHGTFVFDAEGKTLLKEIGK